MDRLYRAERLGSGAAASQQRELRRDTRVAASAGLRAGPPPQRDAVVDRVKRALVMEQDLELGLCPEPRARGLDQRTRGVDPYDSALGMRPRDVWSGRRRA